MSLEFHILVGSGESFEDYSKESVDFEEVEHRDLLDLANKHKLKSLAMIQNYYGEYKFSPPEIDAFISDIDKLIPELPESNKIKSKLVKLRELFNAAKLQNKSMVTFPD